MRKNLKDFCQRASVERKRGVDARESVCVWVREREKKKEKGAKAVEKESEKGWINSDIFILWPRRPSHFMSWPIL